MALNKGNKNKAPTPGNGKAKSNSFFGGFSKLSNVFSDLAASSPSAFIGKIIFVSNSSVAASEATPDSTTVDSMLDTPSSLTSFNDEKCPLHSAIRDIKIDYAQGTKYFPCRYNNFGHWNTRLPCSCDLSSAVVLYRSVLNPTPLHLIYYRFTSASRLAFGTVNTVTGFRRRAFAVLVNDSEGYLTSFEQAVLRNPNIHSEESFVAKDIVEAGFASSMDIRRAEVCQVCDMYNPIRCWLNPKLVGCIILTAQSKCVEPHVPEIYEARDFFRFAKVCVSCEALGIKDSAVARTKARFVEEYKKEIIRKVSGMFDTIHDMDDLDASFDVYYDKAKAIDTEFRPSPVVYSSMLDTEYPKAIKLRDGLMKLTMTFGYDDKIDFGFDCGEMLDKAYENSLEEEDCTAAITEPTPRPDVITARANPRVLEAILTPVLEHNFNNLSSSPAAALVYRPGYIPSMTSSTVATDEDEGWECEYCYNLYSSATTYCRDCQPTPEKPRLRSSYSMPRPARQYVASPLRQSYTTSDDLDLLYDVEYARQRFTEAYLNHTARHDESVARRFLKVAIPILEAYRETNKLDTNRNILATATAPQVMVSKVRPVILDEEEKIARAKRRIGYGLQHSPDYEACVNLDFRPFPRDPDYSTGKRSALGGLLARDCYCDGYGAPEDLQPCLPSEGHYLKVVRMWGDGGKTLLSRLMPDVVSETPATFLTLAGCNENTEQHALLLAGCGLVPGKKQAASHGIDRAADVWKIAKSAPNYFMAHNVFSLCVWVLAIARHAGWEGLVHDVRVICPSCSTMYFKPAFTMAFFEDESCACGAILMERSITPGKASKGIQDRFVDGLTAVYIGQLELPQVHLADFALTGKLNSLEPCHLHPQRNTDGTAMASVLPYPITPSVASGFKKFRLDTMIFRPITRLPSNAPLDTSNNRKAPIHSKLLRDVVRLQYWPKPSIHSGKDIETTDPGYSLWGSCVSSRTSALWLKLMAQHPLEAVLPYPMDWTCCDYDTNGHDFVIAHGEGFKVILSNSRRSRTSPNFTWVADSHRVEQPAIPWVSSRGDPRLATLPMHAHGHFPVYDKVGRFVTQCLVPASSTVMDVAKYLGLAAQNGRHGHRSIPKGPITGKPLSECGKCGIEGWFADDNLCGTCSPLNCFERMDLSVSGHATVHKQLVLQKNVNTGFYKSEEDHGNYRSTNSRRLHDWTRDDIMDDLETDPRQLDVAKKCAYLIDTYVGRFKPGTRIRVVADSTDDLSDMPTINFTSRPRPSVYGELPLYFENFYGRDRVLACARLIPFICGSSDYVFVVQNGYYGFSRTDFGFPAVPGKINYGCQFRNGINLGHAVAYGSVLKGKVSLDQLLHPRSVIYGWDERILYSFPAIRNLMTRSEVPEWPRNKSELVPAPLELYPAGPVRYVRLPNAFLSKLPTPQTMIKTTSTDPLNNPVQPVSMWARFRSVFDVVSRNEKAPLPLLGDVGAVMPLHRANELKPDERTFRSSKYRQFFHAIDPSKYDHQFNDVEAHVITARLERLRTDILHEVNGARHCLITSESRDALPDEDKPHIVPEGLKAIAIVPEGSKLTLPGFTMIQIAPFTTSKREAAFWRLAPIFLEGFEGTRYYCLNSGARPSIGYTTFMTPPGLQDFPATMVNFNSNYAAMAGTLVCEGSYGSSSREDYKRAFNGLARVYGFDEVFLTRHLPSCVLHMGKEKYWDLDGASHSWELTGDRFTISSTSLHVHTQRPRVPVSIPESVNTDLLSDSELLAWYEGGEPTPARYRILNDTCRSRTPIPKSEIFLGIGPKFVQGCDYFPFAERYRGKERSVYRNEHNDDYIHSFRYPERLPYLPRPDFLDGLITAIEDTARRFNGKVVVTACPDGPPPPSSLGFGPFAINGNQAGWVNYSVPVRHGRENAFLRLAVMLTGHAVKDWWIVNGREVELQVLPELRPGRLCTANRYDVTPLVLASTRSDVKLPPTFEFGTWFEMSFGYGLDEVVLKYLPLSCEIQSRPSIHNTWFFPTGEGWQDVEYWYGGELIYKGVVNRLTVQQLFTKSVKVPARPHGPGYMGFLHRRNLNAIEANLKECPVITNVLDDFEGKSQAILFVAYGTRGDILPVKYLANVAYTLGVNCRFYTHAQISSEDLREIVNGRISGQLKHAFGLLGIGRSGFMGYVSPQLRIGSNSLSFEMTPWEYTETIRSPNFFTSALLNFFVSTKSPDLKIGSVLGSNAPRSTDGLRALRIQAQGPRPERIGWVAGSDGIDAVPKWIRNCFEHITDQDHNGQAFAGFTEVWCTGGQGIMQTLRAKDVTPRVYAPGFDRTLCLPNELEYCTEPDIAYFMTALQSLGAHVPARKSYITMLQSLGLRMRLLPGVAILRTFLILWVASGYIWILLAHLASFPTMIQLLNTPVMKAPLAIAYLIWSYPLLFTTFGFLPTIVIITLTHVTTYASKCLLGWKNQTYLVIKVQKQFPPFQHARIVDKKRMEQVQMAFQGGLANLKNPFRGEVSKWRGSEPGHIEIPIPINYPRLARRLLLKTDRYSPWWNCQVVLPSASDWDLLLTLVIAAIQVFTFPIVFIGYANFLLARCLKFSWTLGPPGSFYRFGTDEEYERLQKDIEEQRTLAQSQALTVQALQEELEGRRSVDPLLIRLDYVHTESPVVKAVVDLTKVTVEEEQDVDAVPRPVNPDAILLNPLFDENARANTILNEAVEELKAHPELYNLDDFITHSALLAEWAKRNGMPDEHAYHGAIIALHDFILTIPEPDEVNEWRREFIPIRAARGINKGLQTLSVFIHRSMAELPAGIRSLVQAFYRWVEGLGAKIKLVAIKMFLACRYIGDALLVVNKLLWYNFSKAIMPIFDFMFGQKYAKRFKAVWALGGVAKNPSMSAQRTLQEMYVMASYERDPKFERAYAAAIEDVLKHLPNRDDLGPNLFPSSVKPLGGPRPRIEAAYNEDFVKWMYPKLKSTEHASKGDNPRSQYRPATVPTRATMSAFELDAIGDGKKWTTQEVNELKHLYNTDYPKFLKDVSTAYQSGRVLTIDGGREAKLIHDMYLTEQVLQRLSQGATQTVDHVWEVASNPSRMYEMQERYAYYGLEFDPTQEIIPPELPAERKALYDEVAAHIVNKWPERYQNRTLTKPETLMNYLSLKKQWTRGAGPMFEPSYAERTQLTSLRKNGHASVDGTEHMDISKRFKMWEAGLGYAVLKKAYADAASGKVDVQQFAAFVKSQPTPVDKLARGVTFMPITQWFKGMMECFAQNQRVTWRTTYIGKNMPLGQHMREFFDKVRELPVVGEGDAKQMDSRFQAGILYGLGRIAHHAWTWGSPNVVNGAAIASHKAARYQALQDGWIFNLHIPAKGYKAPYWLTPSDPDRRRFNDSVMVEFNGQRRFFFTRDPALLEKVSTAVRQNGPKVEDWINAIPGMNEEMSDKLHSCLHRYQMLSASHPAYANVTKKIRGGATGLEDTTDLNTDGKKLGTIAALVTFGDLIGKRISVADALDESKYLEAHTSDDNIFGIDPMRLYGITEEEFKSHRSKFIQAFAENNLDMTFLFHEGESDGVRGRYLEYLSHFSRPLTMQDRRSIDRVNEHYRTVNPSFKGIIDPLSGEDPKSVVYINTKAMDARQSANNAYKESNYEHRYLFALICRDVGQANLKAFNFQSYLQNLSAYHVNAMRYLAAAAFPKTCMRNGIASLPEPGSPEDDFIRAHFHERLDKAGGPKSQYRNFRLDGNVMFKKWPKDSNGNPLDGNMDEFKTRLRKLKDYAQFPDYKKVVFDHMKPQKDTKINKTAATLRKVARGTVAVDEGLKQILDQWREVFQAIPKKFTVGGRTTVNTVHPDEIWTGSRRVESSIYRMYLKQCADTNDVPTLGGFSRIINRSPYGGCCDAAAAFHHFNTQQGAAELFEHPDYVWRNACTGISIAYAFSWWVERWILRTPIIGLFWAVMMFALIEIAKIYSVLGLLRWHTTMDADPYIAGLLPRDIYIHHKRFSDFMAGFVPMHVFYILRFDILLDPMTEWFSLAAKLTQQVAHITPMSSTQPGQPMNEWGPIASEVVTELQELQASSRPAVVSVKGPTGTGKSTWLVYELMRLWLIERGGKLFLVAPFNVLRDDWSLPEWFQMGDHETPESESQSQYQILKGGVHMRQNARIYLCTYGHMRGRIERGEVGPNDIVAMDETHLGGPAQVLVHKMLEEKNIAIVNLSATPAKVEGLNQGDIIDATNIVTQKNRKLVEVFPAETTQITMLQEMLTRTEVDPKLGFSHRDMAMRCIVKVNTLSAIEAFIAGVDELRRADPDIPRAFEFSSATFKTQRAEREEYCKKGRYIIVATDIIGVGYDIKPAAYSIIDNGMTIQEHQGFLLRPAPSTADQMEQFHGRVGRNSSDRNGLVYCTAIAGTGIQGQQYGSGSYFVDERVCKAIGVPRLQELPYTGMLPKFNHFDIVPTIQDSALRNGLAFTFLAALSGVAPHELPSFYYRYAEQGYKMPEENEWMEGLLLSMNFRALKAPAWRAIETICAQSPFIVKVQGNQITGRSLTPQDGVIMQEGCSTVGPIYPRAGQWMTYAELSRNKNTVKVTSRITTEAEAYKEMEAVYEKRIEVLERKLRSKVTAEKSLEQERLKLKRQVMLRTDKIALVTTRTAAAASRMVDELKPAIVSAAAAHAKSETELTMAGVDVKASTSPSHKSVTAIVKEALSGKVDENAQRKMKLDKRAAARFIDAALRDPTDVNTAEGSRKSRRAEKNLAYAKFKQQCLAHSYDMASINVAWNMNTEMIIEHVLSNDHVYDLRMNDALTDCIIRWSFYRAARHYGLPCTSSCNDRDEIDQIGRSHGNDRTDEATYSICRNCVHT